MDIDSIAEKVAERKSLSGISLDVIKAEVKKYLLKEKIDINKMNAKDEKIVVHDIRSVMRRLSGSYRNEGQLDDDSAAHASTRERMDFYPQLKGKIYSLSPKSILDLGCGLNPLEIAKKGITYYAYDIDSASISKISDYFSAKGISGFAKAVDVREQEEFPSADVCLMLKLMDVVDDKSNHRNSEALIKKINSRYIIISFPTKTLSGAPMRHPQRGWIEHLLTRLGFTFDFFSSSNEIFYLAERKS